MKEAGWGKTDVRDFLVGKARRSAADWAASYKAETPEPGKEAELIPVCQAPEGVILLAGGGFGGPWSALIPRWGRGSSAAVTREISAGRPR
jgi:hypothetical protein